MSPDEKGSEEISFPELDYPSLRDHPLKSPYVWLVGKTKDDGAEGLWRIHDKLYDFEEFIKNHPGGEFWLSVSKGTDITEAFESHHISTIPETMLDHYYIRNATKKRNSPFTFEDDGLFRMVKRKMRERIKSVPKKLGDKSKRIIEFLAAGMFAFCIISCHLKWGWLKYIICMLAAIFLSWTTTCSHNFIHQKDNWRMYLFNFSGMSTREFRVMHVLSHHQFPNTLYDIELILFEPFFQWLPRKSKSTLVRYGGFVYGLLINPIMFDVNIIVRLITYFKFKNYPAFSTEDLIPFILPFLMYLLGGSNVKDTLVTWLVIIHLAAFIIILISLHAAHHHPDIFHDGDTPRKDRDWGMHQLDAVADRVDINGSLFKVLTNYGDHALHHMFPSVDHAILYELHPAFVEICQEYGEKLRTSSVLEMFLGSFRQLARNECRKKIE